MQSVKAAWAAPTRGKVASVGDHASTRDTIDVEKERLRVPRMMSIREIDEVGGGETPVEPAAGACGA
jgi:hypothetical protein